MPVNIINEKSYVFLWFWFIALAVVSGVSLVYRLIVIFIYQARYYLLSIQARLTPYDQVQTVTRKCQIGDWFILYLLSKNVDPVVFKEVIYDLAHHFDFRKEADISLIPVS